MPTVRSQLASSLIIGLFAGGCAPSRPSPIVRSWDYAADRTAVWSASVRSMEAAGFAIQDSSAVGGVIATSWRQIGPATGYASCSGAVEGRVSLRFGEGVQGVRVTMDTEFRRPDEPRSPPCPSSGKLERDLNAAILGRLPPSARQRP